MEGWISEQGRKLVEKTFVKITEQLKGPGCTNSPEPSELKGIRAYKPQVTPVNGLRSEPPIRRQTPNKSFHRYGPELWSIVAQRSSLCPFCQKEIQAGQLITVFETVGGWSHLEHALTEAMPGNARLEVGGED